MVFDEEKTIKGGFTPNPKKKNYNKIKEHWLDLQSNITQPKII